MKNKDNARINPFEHMLYPDEEILWLYAPHMTTPQLKLKQSLRRLPFIGAGALCILLVAGITQPNALEAWVRIVVTLLAIIVFSVGILYIVTWLQHDRNPAYRYALTCQRLMFATPTTPEWFKVADIKSLYITGDNEQADMTFMVGSAETYTWKDVGECDVVLHRLQKLRETPIKVMRL